MKSNQKALLGVALVLSLAALACVRSAPSADDQTAATEKSAETADAEIQQTLDALLGSATVENAPATATFTATIAPATATASSTVDQLQLTELAATLTAAAASPTTGAVTPSATSTANATSTACYAARYVYDETYPDGTRVNPGETIQKVWRLQNIGTCDWKAGQFQLVFVGGDKMSATTPLSINFTVPAGGYANFTVNLKAPATPGTYHGDWTLQLTSGDNIWLDATSGKVFWVEIVVRGATPTP